MAESPKPEPKLKRGQAGGRALAASVDPSYFKWLGRRGGRKSQYLILKEVAENWNWSPEQVAESKISQRRRDELAQEMRQAYREEAEQKYQLEWGNMVMMELWNRTESKE